MYVGIYECKNVFSIKLPGVTAESLRVLYTYARSIYILYIAVDGCSTPVELYLLSHNMIISVVKPRSSAFVLAMKINSYHSPDLNGTRNKTNIFHSLHQSVSCQQMGME